MKINDIIRNANFSVEEDTPVVEVAAPIEVEDVKKSPKKKKVEEVAVEETTVEASNED